MAARVCLSFPWSLGKFRGGTDIKNKQKLFSGNVACEAQILPSDIEKRRLKKKESSLNLIRSLDLWET